uniref:Uncharacterized protein n=1 Tax=Magallana gigas TaxID=29159 RepID=K1RUK3_MAGGI
MRKLQELFRGRFSEVQARRLLTHHGWALEITVDFVFEDGDILPGICVHPKSLGRKVVTPSDQHISSGSTVDTFLTQDGLASISSASSRPNLSDIDEDN